MNAFVFVESGEDAISEHEAHRLYQTTGDRLGFTANCRDLPNGRRDMQRKRYNAQGQLTALNLWHDDDGLFVVFTVDGQDELCLRQGLAGNWTLPVIPLALSVVGLPLAA